MLDVHGVTCVFGGLTALDDVSFTARAGEITGVIGPNGAGKTTLFNIVTGIYTRTAGRVVLDDRDISGLPPDRLARLGLVRTFQNIELFGQMTVLENVMVGLHTRSRSGFLACACKLPHHLAEERRIREQAFELLEFVGIQELANTVAANLPFGKGRMLEIARALAVQPRIMLMDEPAAGLNSRETWQLGQLIRKIRETGVTVVLVEHDMELVMDICDTIVVLNLGRKLAEGTPRQIQENPAVIAAYLGKGREQAMEMLKVKNINTYYGQVHALKNVSLHLKQREIVTLIGANGAGKTTILNSLSAVTPLRNGEIFFEGEPIHALAPERIVDLGISQVPEGRQVFKPLTVEDNLELGAYLRYRRREGRAKIRASLDEVYQLFPRLRERRKQLAGTLSGGEQQMLAIGRALMARPKLLLLDEPSMGLAPLVVQEIFAVIAALTRDLGTTVLLVEQNAKAALKLADRGYVLETGKVILEESAAELLENREVQRAYLGKEKKEIWER